jgi:hypothetical protein
MVPLRVAHPAKQAGDDPVLAAAVLAADQRNHDRRQKANKK